MSVAVVIINYNSGALLRRCLQHVRQQTHQADSVIIVDNASTDQESAALLGELTDAVVIRSEKNLGFGAAANLAVKSLLDVDLVCFLNPDAFVADNWLQELVAAADLHPDCGSFASLLLMEKNTGLIDGAGDDLHFTGLPWRRFHGYRRDSVSIERARQFSACAGAAMYRVDAFNEVGGFDESYFLYVEDIDLGFRLQLNGHPCLLVAEAIAHHIGSAIAGRYGDLSIYYGHRNLVWCYFTNMPLGLLVLTLPFHLIMNVLMIVVLTARGHGRAISKSKLDAIKGLPRAWAKRTGTRTLSTVEVWRLLNKSLFRGVSPQ